MSVGFASKRLKLRDSGACCRRQAGLAVEFTILRGKGQLRCTSSILVSKSSYDSKRDQIALESARPEASVEKSLLQ
jgi:hypothetical protein